MLADLNEPEPPLKSISEMGDVESALAAESNQDGARPKPKAPAKRKSKSTKEDDDSVKTRRAPRKKKTADSAMSDAGTSAATGADNETPPVSRRGSTRKRGAARGRTTTRGKRGRSTSRASSTITSTTLANDHDQEDFDDDWGRSIDQAIANEMLEGSTSLNGTGTDKENSVPAEPASRPRPRKKQKVSAEAE